MVMLSRALRTVPVTSLSGGQQQRVAIARALINEPQVLLLDEPLGALDLKLRKDMQQELKKIQKNTGITFIFVTHDQEEALSMSDTIVVMSPRARSTRSAPRPTFTTSRSERLRGGLHRREQYRRRRDAGGLPGQLRRAGPSDCLDSGFAKNEPVDVVIRPEDVDIVPPGQGEAAGVRSRPSPSWACTTRAIVDIDGFKWMIQTTDLV